MSLEVLLMNSTVGLQCMHPLLVATTTINNTLTYPNNLNALTNTNVVTRVTLWADDTTSYNWYGLGMQSNELFLKRKYLLVEIAWKSSCSNHHRYN